MANRVSTCNVQTLRFVFDSDATISLTLNRAVEVVDFWFIEPAAGAADTLTLTNSGVGAISAVTTAGVANGINRATTAVLTRADIAAAGVLQLSSGAGNPTGIRAYVSILPGVTSTT